MSTKNVTRLKSARTPDLFDASVQLQNAYGVLDVVWLAITTQHLDLGDTRQNSLAASVFAAMGLIEEARRIIEVRS